MQGVKRRASLGGDLMQGKVKIFCAERYFGFIATEAGDFFFHGSKVLGDPVTAGDEVEFWLDESPRGGLAAVEVQRIVTHGAKSSRCPDRNGRSAC